MSSTTETNPTPADSGVTSQEEVKEHAMRDQNLYNIRYIVRRSENPHPMTIVIVVIISLLAMCFVYRLFIKPSVSGTWVDTKNKKHIINHNKYTDEINVDGQFYGVIKGNLIVFYVDDKMKMGVWLKNEIEWTDGDRWQCICGY